MRKIPDLRGLVFSRTFESWSFTFSLLAFTTLTCGLLTLLACGSLSTPEYSSNGDDYESSVGDYRPQGAPLASTEELTTPPEEIYQSEDVLKVDRSRMPKEAFKLHWPIAEKTMTRGGVVISRGFSASGAGTHLGLDLAGPRGTPIYSAHSGIVIYAGAGFRGFGKLIIIEYDGTMATFYGHLNRFKVKTGQWVPAGHLIGLMGRTGVATGNHLHFEVIKGQDKQPVDPLPLLPVIALPSRK